MKMFIRNFIAALIQCIAIVLFGISCAKHAQAVTTQDLKDLWCYKDCVYRDYNMGWALPSGKCRCSDDFELTFPFPLKLNVHGRMVEDAPPTYYIIRESN